MSSLGDADTALFQDARWHAVADTCDQPCEYVLLCILHCDSVAIRVNQRPQSLNSFYAEKNRSMYLVGLYLYPKWVLAHCLPAYHGESLSVRAIWARRPRSLLSELHGQDFARFPLSLCVSLSLSLSLSPSSFFFLPILRFPLSSPLSLSLSPFPISISLSSLSLSVSSISLLPSLSPSPFRNSVIISGATRPPSFSLSLSLSLSLFSLLSLPLLASSCVGFNLRERWN